MKKTLPTVVELKGDCRGIVATQIERTRNTALYRRSDNYWECFYIKEVKQSTFNDGTWQLTGDTIERYPRIEDFGKWAWCDKENSIRKKYIDMNGTTNVISADDV